MLCVNCGKDAAKLYTRESNGREVRITLCPACYAVLYPEREEESDFFASFVDGAGNAQKTCPACGMALDHFRHTGLLGCATCYTAFRTELLPTVRFAQGKVKHEGKAPSGVAEKRYDEIRTLVVEKEELKAALKDAERRSDTFAVLQLEHRLAEINRKLYGGEED